MNGEGTSADGFEFNLTRVLEKLDRRGRSSPDAAAPAEPPAADPPDPGAGGLDAAEPDAAEPWATSEAARDVAIQASPEPLVITPMSDDVAAPLPHRVPSRHESGQRTRPATRPARAAAFDASRAEPLPARTASANALTREESKPPALFDDPARGEARATLHRVPPGTNLTAAAEPVPVLPAPRVAQAPAPPPPESAAMNAVRMPTVADVRQFQSAQRRQARKGRQGRMAGRVMLVLIVVTAAVAAALTVGRNYLFPADWADDLAPLVDEVERAHGTEFDQVVPLVDQPESDYTATVTRTMFGPDPAQRIAVWRALGLASGDVDRAAAGRALVAIHPGVYDAEHHEIVRLEGAADGLRPLLDAALIHQLDDRAAVSAIDVLGPLPVVIGDTPAHGGASTLPDVASISVPAPDPATADAGVADPAALSAALPLQYQLAATDRLAPAVTPSGLALLDDVLSAAPEPALAPGDVPATGPVSLGIDDWTLVWANRLPAGAVDTLIAGTTADSVVTFERGGTTCVAAVFGAGNELYAAALHAELGAWAAGAPAEAEAEASVTGLAPTYVQLSVCDPGAGVPQVLDAGAVAAVLDRQLARLSEVAAAPPSVPAG